MNEKDIKLAFSFIDDRGETVNLEKIFCDGEDIGTIYWLLNEFKYFLNAMSFPERMTDRIVYLEQGDSVVDKHGTVLVRYE